MQQIIVKNIPENKLGFFLELVKNLGFTIEVKSKEEKFTRKQQKFVEGLNDALNDVDMHLKGKKKLKSVDQLLDDL